MCVFHSSQFTFMTRNQAAQLAFAVGMILDVAIFSLLSYLGFRAIQKK